MSKLIVLLPVIVPVLFWVDYHVHADRHLPKPPAHLLLAFGLGVASFWIGLYVYGALEFVDLRRDAFELAETNLGGLFVYSPGVIGLPSAALPLSAVLIAGIWIWRLRLIRDLHGAAITAGARTPSRPS